VLATNGPIMAALDDGECGALGGEEWEKKPKYHKENCPWTVVVPMPPKLEPGD
jgi:hypothetical protein